MSCAAADSATSADALLLRAPESLLPPRAHELRCAARRCYAHVRSPHTTCKCTCICACWRGVSVRTLPALALSSCRCTRCLATRHRAGPVSLPLAEPTRSSTAGRAVRTVAAFAAVPARNEQASPRGVARHATLARPSNSGSA
eukprot:scaffold44086_cov63-Phaeocystis_antarctica.AAC.2